MEGYDSNFNLDAVLETLGRVNNGFTQDSPEEEALRIAAVALLYLRDTQKLEEYREYFRRFLTHRPVLVARSFSTRTEADAWLSSGSARDGELVSIAGQGFTVIQALHGLKFLRTPLPTELGG
ncbi:MAG: hypothetical protein ABW123_23040 [Cystobacter sp.]